MKREFPVSLDDITDALQRTDKHTLAEALATDILGPEKKGTEQFAKHVMAYKAMPMASLITQAVKLVFKNSPSIAQSTGCYLDKGKSIPLNFERALNAKLEEIVGSLDSAICGSNPAASINTARTIVKDWTEAKIGTSLKHDLSNGNLSIEYRVGAVRVAVTPRSEISENKLMEAAPILNELSEALKTLSERKYGRSIPEQGLHM